MEHFVEKDYFCKQLGGNKMGIEGNTPRIPYIRQQSVFIRPESDHWECLSVTDSLTD